MSAIVPWTEPGGTPCCCEQDCPLFSLNPSPPSSPDLFRNIELTSTEYATLLAGGSFLCETSVSASVQGTAGERTLSISGSRTYTAKHTLTNSLGFVVGFRGFRCDQLVFVETVEDNNNASGEKTLDTSPIFYDFLISERVRWLPMRVGQSDIIDPIDSIGVAVYNDGFPNKYGMFFRRASRHSLEHVLRLLQVSIFGNPPVITDPDDPNQTGGSFVFALTARINTTMESPLTDNSTFELILPTRTINIPCRRFLTSFMSGENVTTSGSFTVSQDKATYSPAAP